MLAASVAMEIKNGQAKENKTQKFREGLFVWVYD